MSKIKDKITRIFKQIFRKNDFSMIANVSKQNYDDIILLMIPCQKYLEN